MKSQLDQLIEDLRGVPADADLSQVAPKVWRRIDRIRRAQFADIWLLPARVGAIVFALTAGVALGAAHAREAVGSQEIAAFEVAGGLAPSTLLDKH